MQLPYLRAQAVASQLLSHAPLPGALCESQAVLPSFPQLEQEAEASLRGRLWGRWMGLCAVNS